MNNNMQFLREAPPLPSNLVDGSLQFKYDGSKASNLKSSRVIGSVNQGFPKILLCDPILENTLLCDPLMGRAYRLHLKENKTIAFLSNNF